MTPKQIQKARTMLSKAGIKGEEHKKDLVSSFSDGRTESLTAMDYAETQDLFKHLEALAGQEPTAADKMRRKILSIAHEMHMHHEGTRRIDMIQVNKWLLGKGGFGKTLGELTEADLRKAVTAFEKVLLSYLKRI